MNDPVNSPAHYNATDLETIEVIEGGMTYLEKCAYLRGNVIKYLSRYKYKGNPVQDVSKALWYLDRLHSIVYHEHNKKED